MKNTWKKIAFCALSAGMLLSGCGEAKTYTAKFETNGGTAVLDYTGSVIEKAPVTAKSGYTFDGWHLNADLTDPDVVFPYTLTKDLTMYAEWRLKEYVVTFVTNGGTAVEQMTTSIIEESPVTTRNFYRFAGWYENATFSGSKVRFPLAITKATTLYAKWEEGEPSTPEGENFVSATTASGTAKSYWNAHYTETGVHFDINVIDKKIYAEQTAYYLNDCVEVIIGKGAKTAAGTVTGKSYNILVDAKGHILYQVAKNHYATAAGWMPVGDGETPEGLVASATQVSYDEAGWSGYKVSIDASYEVMGTTKAEGYGDIAFAPAMRNADDSVNTAWATTSAFNCEWRHAWTYIEIAKTGGFQHRSQEVENLIFGDSYTDFDYWNSIDQDFPEGTYSFGIGGTVASQWLPKVDAIAAWNPSNMIMNIGVNDINTGVSVNDTFNNIKTLVTTLHEKLPNSHFFLCNVNPCYYVTFNKPANWTKMKQLNVLTKGLEDELNYFHQIDTAHAIAIDYESGEVNNTLFKDTLHYNDVGYSLYAKTIREALGYATVEGQNFGTNGQLNAAVGYDLSQDNGANPTITQTHIGSQVAFMKGAAKTDFTAKATIAVNGILESDSNPKVGLHIKAGTASLFVYLDMHSNGEIFGVGYVPLRHSASKWGTDTVLYWDYMWGECDSGMPISPISVTGGNKVTLEFVKSGSAFTIKANNEVVLSKDNITGFGASDACYAGVQSFNTNFTASNYSFN